MDSRFRGNDDGGDFSGLPGWYGLLIPRQWRWGRHSLLPRTVWIPAFAGMTVGATFPGYPAGTDFRFRGNDGGSAFPYYPAAAAHRFRGNGGDGNFLRPWPLWIPAFAGMTGVGGNDGGWAGMAVAIGNDGSQRRNPPRSLHRRRLRGRRYRHPPVPPRPQRRLQIPRRYAGLMLRQLLRRPRRD